MSEEECGEREKRHSQTDGPFLDGCQGSFQKRIMQRCPSLKAELACADPQLLSQVRSMSLAHCPWTWSMAHAYGRGRDVVEMPVAFTRGHKAVWRGRGGWTGRKRT